MARLLRRQPVPPKNGQDATRLVIYAPAGVSGTVATTNNNDAAAASGWAGTITGTSATTNANDAASAAGASASSKVGGDDAPRYEIWDKRKAKKRKDEELDTAVKAAFDKAMGRAEKPSATPPFTAPAITPVTLAPNSDNDEDEDEAILLML